MHHPGKIFRLRLDDATSESIDGTSMHAKRTITAKQLTILMVVLITGPIASGLLLSFFTPRTPEPTLPALVKLDSIWITPSEKPNDRRLVPCISIKNPTASRWRNLSIGLNDQFYSQEPRGVEAGEMISIPLEVFVARNGSVRFPVGNRDIKLVTVFAQVETGSRAVSEHTMPAKSFVRRKGSGADDEGWVVGH